MIIILFVFVPAFQVFVIVVPTSPQLPFFKTSK